MKTRRAKHINLFEHRSHPIANMKLYNRRVVRYALIASALILVSLGIGMLGYKYIVGVAGWDDAFLNASMILTGMGPVIADPAALTTAAKIFSGLYAIYSGVAFLSSIAIFFTPIVHRFFHLLHLDIDDDENA